MIHLIPSCLWTFFYFLLFIYMVDRDVKNPIELLKRKQYCSKMSHRILIFIFKYLYLFLHIKNIYIDTFILGTKLKTNISLVIVTIQNAICFSTFMFAYIDKRWITFCLHYFVQIKEDWCHQMYLAYAMI